jgi:hypothetical protein
MHDFDLPAAVIKGKTKRRPANTVLAILKPLHKAKTQPLNLIFIT